MANLCLTEMEETPVQLLLYVEEFNNRDQVNLSLINRKRRCY